eukprot:341513-Prorocentrum_minimum.AAC.1
MSGALSMWDQRVEIVGGSVSREALELLRGTLRRAILEKLADMPPVAGRDEHLLGLPIKKQREWLKQQRVAWKGGREGVAQDEGAGVDSGCRMGSNMEDEGNDNRGGNRGNHSNKGRSKRGGDASDRPEKCSEGRMS